MAVFEKLKSLISGKHSAAVVTALGAAGLLLILLSSVQPDKNDETPPEAPAAEVTAESYCAETEKRLEAFLRQVDGAGDVRVYLTVSTGERYIYATEGRSSRTENKSEEEEKYVIVGGGSDKNALVETVESPEITGAVIACAGCDSPAVQERIYKAVSAALGISTGNIYVTKLINQK